MSEELYDYEDVQVEPFTCVPATILKFLAEILAVVGIIGGLAVFSTDPVMGIACLIGGLLLPSIIWVLSLIVRVCYKYLNIN